MQNNETGERHSNLAKFRGIAGNKETVNEEE